MTSCNFEAAYQKEFKRTTAFLLSRGLKREAAIEVAQSAWVRGWESLSQLRDEKAISAWVNSIAINLYRFRLRRLGREDELMRSHMDRLTTLQNTAAIDVDKILSQCRPADRELLEADMSGITTEEMASARRISQTAIRIRMMRARRAARQLCATQRRVTN